MLAKPSLVVPRHVKAGGILLPRRRVGSALNSDHMAWDKITMLMNRSNRGGGSPPHSVPPLVLQRKTNDYSHCRDQARPAPRSVQEGEGESAQLCFLLKASRCLLRWRSCRRWEGFQQDNQRSFSSVCVELEPPLRARPGSLRAWLMTSPRHKSLFSGVLGHVWEQGPSP